MQFNYGKYTVRLYWEGETLHFDRFFDGIGSSKLSHVFDNRQFDPFKVHRIEKRIIARQIHWCCSGRDANLVDLAALTMKIAPLVERHRGWQKLNQQRPLRAPATVAAKQVY